MKKRVVKPAPKQVVKFGPESKIPFVGEKRGLTKPQVLSELTKSPHGDLSEYLKVGVQAASEDPDFFGHLVAWNHVKGQVRDAKVALPVIALRAGGDEDYVENALAHLADLRPREFARALMFARQIGVNQRLMRRLVERYLRDLEADFFDWERTSLLHRSTIKGFYSKYHIKPNKVADDTLFKDAPIGGRFAAVKLLKNQTPEQIAGAIRGYKLPFMVVKAALGAKIKEPDVLCAVIQGMTTPELITNMASLERWGVKTVPALRAALEQAMTKAKDAKASKGTLKTTKAAEALAGDEQLSGKLKDLQEKQLDKLQMIEGNWLVIADRSGSMEGAIEGGRQVAAILCRSVKGGVALSFVNNSPQTYDVTGKTLEEITKLTKGIMAFGGTSLGCALKQAQDNKLQVDGIVVISDGEDNQNPYFHMAYLAYVEAMGVEPTVYFYKMGSGSPLVEYCAKFNIDLQTFELGQSVDYYSLPNLVQTMRVGRYSLLDEVLATSLKTVDQVLDRTKGQRVVSREAVTA